MRASPGKAQRCFLADAQGGAGDQTDLALHGLRHRNEVAYG
jgi:hypothetical protein